MVKGPLPVAQPTLQDRVVLYFMAIAERQIFNAAYMRVSGGKSSMKQLRGSGILSSSGKSFAEIEYDLTVCDEAGVAIYRGILAGSPCLLSTAQGLGDAALILDDGKVVWLAIKSLKGECAFVAGSNAV